MYFIRQLALALFLCLAGATAFADTTEFRVDSYIPDRFTDLLWRINGNLYMSGNTSDQTNDPAAGEYVGTADGSGSQQQGAVQSSISYRRTTIQRFLDLDASAGFNGSRFGSSSNSRMQLTDSPIGFDTSSQSHISWNYSGNLSGRVHAGQFVAGDFFVGGQVYGNFEYSASPTDESSDYRNKELPDDIYIYSDFRDQFIDSRRTTRSVYSDGAIEVGYGRVYDGVYGSSALHIVDVLGQQGLLDREPAFAEMMQLAEILHHERESHKIDDRLGKIVSLERIMEFLSSAGIVRESGSVGYPYLFDVWDYFPRDARRFGWRIILSAGYDYRHRRDDRSEEGYRNLRTTRYHVDSASVVDTLLSSNAEEHANTVTQYEDRVWYGEGRIEYYRPYHRHWQLDASFFIRAYPEYSQIRRSVGFRYKPTPAVSRSSSSANRDDWVRWQAQVNLRYIFDRRTTADFVTSLAYTNSAGSVYDPYHQLDLTFQPRITYRISIPTTLNLHLTVSHSESSWPQRVINHWNYSMGGSVGHYLY